MKRLLCAPEMQRARVLAATLGLVLSAVAGYSQHVQPTRSAQHHPSDSIGSSTLVVTASIAKAMARENARPSAAAPAERTTIAWASPWGRGKPRGG